MGTVDGHAVFPSRNSLLLRCEAGASFGWVQAILQLITFIPRANIQKELRDSPMIYKVEIATSGDQKLDIWLPVDQKLGLDGSLPKRMHLSLAVSGGVASKTPLDYRVEIIGDEGKLPLGSLRFSLSEDGAVSMSSDPPKTLDRLTEWLARSHARSPGARVSLDVSGQTPQAIAVRVLDLIRGAGITGVEFSKISETHIRDIEQGLKQ
jgi:hypothetical protein